MNSAPLTGPVDAATFRNIAKAMSAGGGQHPDRVAAARAGPDRVLRRRRRRQRRPVRALLRRRPGRPGQPQRQRPAATPREQSTQAAGTGFIISKDGFILTNNHVVEGATKIEVSLYGEDDDVSYEAKVVGRDPLTDSALIELTEKPNHALPEVKFGDSAQMQPGDWVMAIGNPFGLAHTVSVGVISATERPLPGRRRPQRGRAADRRRDQPGQLGRTAAQPARRGDRHQHRDLHRLAPGRATSASASRSRSTPCASCCRSCAAARSRAAASACQVGTIPLDALDEFGLKERKGALVGVGDAAAAPAAKAGIEPGDVIIEFNGKPVKQPRRAGRHGRRAPSRARPCR